MQSRGFRYEDRDTLRFWFRQSPVSIWADRFYGDQSGEESFARINPENPRWVIPGELVELDPAGRLIQFRAIPFLDPGHLNFQEKPHWQEWFPKDLTGFDLSAMEPIEERGPPVPDAFDQLQVWKGTHPGAGGDIYVQAAAWARKPVSFRIFSLAEIDGKTPSMAMGRLYQPQKTSASRVRGEGFFAALAVLVLSGAIVLAWRNVRLGRCDRKGAFRVAFFLFCTGMLAWLFLASHNAANEMEILGIGMARSLGKVAFFWLCYLSLEPHIRRRWPQVLISWSRLVNGQWRDPLVGQNLLLGVLAGVITWLTFDALQTIPLTTNFSAWYAGNGLAAVAFFFALAAFGYYTSQARQPIFQQGGCPQ